MTNRPVDIRGDYRIIRWLLIRKMALRPIATATWGSNQAWCKRLLQCDQLSLAQCFRLVRLKGILLVI
jgi:hypothetical protein